MKINLLEKSGLKFFLGLFFIIFIILAATNSYAQNKVATGNVIFGQAYVGQTTSPSSTPYLLHVSESLNPGDTLTLQGSVYPTATVFLQQVVGNNTPISLNVLSATYNVIQAQIPSNIPFGLWEVWVVANGNTSNVMMVNQARGVRFEYDQVTPGGAFGIFGRNLVEANYTPEVTFVDGAGVNHLATNVSGNAFQLNAVAPSDLVPGASYTVYINNGMGGYGQGMFTQVNDPLTVRAGGVDAFNLGVPWASDFAFYNNVYNVKTDSRLTVHAVGDGVTDDYIAINDALIAASRASINGITGGVVYLPAGTYFISGSLQLFSDVVLEGAGPNNTTIIYDTGTTSTKFAFTQGSSTFGIMNLGIQNLPANYNKYTTGAEGSLSIENYTSNPCSEFFLNNVNFTYSDGNATEVTIQGYNEVLIENSTFNSTGGSFFMDGENGYTVAHATFLNNNITYHFGRVSVDYDDHPLFIGNDFILDESFLTSTSESGGIQVSYTKMPVFVNNTIEDINNTVTSYFNYGDSIMTQDASGVVFKDVGTIASVSGQTATLTSSTNSSLPTNFPVATSYMPEVIQILDGPAMGQWRTIVSNTSTSVTLDSPWEIVPPAGSHYALDFWSANNLYVLGNTIKNRINSLQIYSGGVDNVIANNNFTNAVGIALYGQERTNTIGGVPPVMQTFVDPLWNTYVEGNTITDQNNDPVRGKALIAINFAQVNPQAWGNVVLNAEVRNNTLICDIACLGSTSTSQDVTYTGYNGFTNIHPGGSDAVLNYNTAGVLGCVFEDNQVSGFSSGTFSFFESPDVDQTVLDLPLPPPSSPTGLVATAGNSNVVLTWTAVAGATGYNVKRSTVSAGPYTTIAPSVTTTTYTDTAVSNGTVYYYVVSAVNQFGESTNSAQVDVRPLSTLSYVLTVSEGPNGTISPTGAVSVTPGASQTFTLTANTGYMAKLTIDGIAVTLVNNSYTLSNVTANHVVAVNFNLNVRNLNLNHTVNVNHNNIHPG